MTGTAGRAAVLSMLLLCTAPVAGAHGRVLVNADRVHSLRADVRVDHVLDVGAGAVRLAKDRRTGTLYVLTASGDIDQVDLATATLRTAYTRAQHGVPNPQGFAIGPHGTFYLVGNEDRPGGQTRATIAKGTLRPDGQRVWSVLAQTVDYPKSNTAFDHRFNGIVVDPGGNYIYVNSGSRTDHGEVQAAGGLFPGTREVGLTACVLRLPTTAASLVLPDDRAALRRAGFVYAEGTRNAFDLTFAPNGDLLATDNGPDRDMSDELNWLRPGRNYGFPWRIGGTDNPQQYPGYDPSKDRLLDPRFYAVAHGYYHNDPGFPPRPSTPLVEPIQNLGPDADSYRDPADGLVRDASALGQSISTFTAHRTPLGLIFANSQTSPEFRGAAFVLGWTQGDATGDSVAGPFDDPGEDLLHLQLTKSPAGVYTARTYRLVAGFANPIDTAIKGNQIFVLEYGGSGGLWRITLPPANAARRTAGP